MTYNFGTKTYELSSRTHLIGILNLTPDSFSDGGLYEHIESAINHAKKMIDDGADFIDVGGESTKPGAEPVSVDEELRRVIPVIEQLSKISDIPISIDTYKSVVAEEALKAGAVIVNDITALKGDGKMVEIISRYGASVILMHIQGTPKNMQEHPHYEHLMNELCLYFLQPIGIAEKSGIKQIIIDPGIGFGKTVQHNLEILKNLHILQRFKYPILIGTSRKSFIGKILDLPVNERLEGTSASVAVSIINGANIVRVHDVKEMKRVARIVDAIKQVDSVKMDF